ncbi:hypothetical protein GCM10023189_42240 [Nibrella saemangeumensis]|uniref:CAAX prenyl protease 2/Lysostaphin resistance protein A-like domain-containing protein n=1 Tax=Nibrella saemangeumensis TaxID=1084526 RepID=A0ABP8NA29_9BACT
MRTLWRYLRTHLQADFRTDLYLTTALYAAILIAINYWLDLENSIIDNYRGSYMRPLLYFCLYSVAYYGGVLIWTYFHRQQDVLRQRRFWIHTLFGLTVYSYYAGFYGYVSWSEQLFDGEIYTFAYRCLSNLHSVITVALPLYLYYRLWDREHTGFYGIRPKRAGLQMYAGLLLIMVPLITWASFQPDFLSFYPSYKDTNANEFFGVPEWVTALIFELAYGWDFIPTELMFRGFLVIGLSRLLGPGTVLSMIVVYASIHFGKPLGETISSLVGGYLLGVFALYSRSIWGGVLIHLGVAWLMELAAFLQLYFRS